MTIACLQFLRPDFQGPLGQARNALRSAFSRCSNCFCSAFFCNRHAAARSLGGSDVADVGGRTGNAYSPVNTRCGEDGVRAAMDSVYIESDVLMGSAAWSAPLLRRSQQPPSIIDGAEGLPNNKAPFFQARQAAAESRRWLIVNLQHPDNKCSEALNLVWASPNFCDGILSKECMLWQRDVSHAQAEPFINYYLDGNCPSAEDSPLVIVVDPRTGRALRRWKADMVEFPLDIQLAVEQVTNFLEMHTLEGFSPPESPQHTPTISPQAPPVPLGFSLDSAEEAEFNLEEVDMEGMDENQRFNDEICKALDTVQEKDAELCHPDEVNEHISWEEEEAILRSLSEERLAACASPSPGEPIKLLLRWPNGSRSEHELKLDESLLTIMTIAAAGLAQHEPQGADKELGISDVLLETASPPLRELHRLPRSTPVGNLDLHRRVLNVRLKEDA